MDEEDVTHTANAFVELARRPAERVSQAVVRAFPNHHVRPLRLIDCPYQTDTFGFYRISIVGHYIKERTKNAQFVIISLRNNMFELADRLVGVYKTNNTTKTVAINPGAFSVGAGNKIVAAKATAGNENSEDAENVPPNAVSA